ncbi:MAG: MBOAT family protein [Lachnospiraceae bacterium]|nr:MBOAT family protein [Lachnospiraceae bacterium]MBQ9234023.1 MBOAT family protein [Lachnospiraceae bacterium]
MVFSGIAFISVFLFAVFVLYTLIPQIKIKNILLIIFSLIFYSVGEPKYVFLMIGSAFFNYICGILVSGKSKKIWLVISIVLNLSCLILFKYSAFFINEINKISGSDIKAAHITMPIGISFFTFQAMSYVIDVYRKETPYQKNFLNVLLYISFFPQLIAGPIIKYHDMENEIIERKQSVDDIEYGIRRFIKGLSKKVLISNTIAYIVDSLMAMSFPWTFFSAWVMAIGYTLQIYYDFSGYSDMAIGLGRMFGFHFKENFNYPYASSTIKEFWRRWHISLSTWFKEYVYIPLGGNRRGKKRTFINKYIVFILTGIWHGANWTFLFWGLFHGLFITLEDTKHLSINNIKSKFIKHIFTMLVVIVAFVVFRADSIGQGITIIVHMFTFRQDVYADSLVVSLMTPYNILMLLAGVICSFPWVILLKNKIKKTGSTALTNAAHIISGVILLLLLLLCMMSLASGSYNPFIYFRF